MFAQPWRFLILQPQEEIKGKLFLQKFTLEDFSILQYKNLGPLFDTYTVSPSVGPHVWFVLEEFKSGKLLIKLE